MSSLDRVELEAELFEITGCGVWLWGVVLRGLQCRCNANAKNANAMCSAMGGCYVDAVQMECRSVWVHGLRSPEGRMGRFRYKLLLGAPGGEASLEAPRN